MQRNNPLILVVRAATPLIVSGEMLRSDVHVDVRVLSIARTFPEVRRGHHLGAAGHLGLTDGLVLLLLKDAVHGAYEARRHEVLQGVPLVVVELAELFGVEEQILLEFRFKRQYLLSLPFILNPKIIYQNQQKLFQRHLYNHLWLLLGAVRVLAQGPTINITVEARKYTFRSFVKW